MARAAVGAAGATAAKVCGAGGGGCLVCYGPPDRSDAIAEALPIAVITRFIGWFHEFGIPVGGVVVNMLIDRTQVEATSPEFVRNRLAMQSDLLGAYAPHGCGSLGNGGRFL